MKWRVTSEFLSIKNMLCLTIYVGIRGFFLRGGGWGSSRKRRNLKIFYVCKIITIKMQMANVYDL